MQSDDHVNLCNLKIMLIYAIFKATNLATVKENNTPV